MVNMELEESCKLCGELSKSTILITHKLLGKDLFNVVENITGIQLRAIYPRVDELFLCQKCALGLIQAETMVEKIRRVLSNLPVATEGSENLSTTENNHNKRKLSLSSEEGNLAAKKPNSTKPTPVKTPNGIKQVKSKPTTSEEKVKTTPKKNEKKVENNKVNATPKTPSQTPKKADTTDTSATASSTKKKSITPKNKLDKSIEDSLISVEEPSRLETSSNTSSGISQNSKTKEIAENFKCEHCSYETKSPKLFRTHLVTKHDIEKPRIFKCAQCSEAYQRQHLLQQHISYVHEHKPRPRNFACPDCDKMFLHRGALLSHAKTHTGSGSSPSKELNCSENNYAETFDSEANLSDHKPSVHKSPPSATPTKANIKKESNTPKKKHKCSTCDKTFLQAEKLQAHIDESHPENQIKKEEDAPKKKHKCTTCDKTFLQAEKLQAHIDESHSENQLNECAKCHLTFLSKQKYEEHCEKDSCSKEKLYSCKFPDCVKRFNTIKKMLSHMEKKHIDSD